MKGVLRFRCSGNFGRIRRSPPMPLAKADGGGDSPYLLQKYYNAQSKKTRVVYSPRRNAFLSRRLKFSMVLMRYLDKSPRTRRRTTRHPLRRDSLDADYSRRLAFDGTLLGTVRTLATSSLDFSFSRDHHQLHTVCYPFISSRDAFPTSCLNTFF